jgi:hypothetical protein
LTTFNAQMIGCVKLRVARAVKVTGMLLPLTQAQCLGAAAARFTGPGGDGF